MWRRRKWEGGDGSGLDDDAGDDGDGTDNRVGSASAACDVDDKDVW